MGGRVGDVSTVVLLIALPVLVAYLCGAAAGAGLLMAVRAGVRAVLGVVSGLVPRPLTLRVPVTAVRRVPVGFVRHHDDPALGTCGPRATPVFAA